jgi:hypothetical protein
MREIRIPFLLLGLIITGLPAKAQTSSPSRQRSKPHQSRSLVAHGSSLPATPAAGNHGTVFDLKVVSVAVATMRDALQRTTLGSTGAWAYGEARGRIR